MGLGDFEYALKFRDMLQGLVKSEVEAQRPRLQYATVTAIDRVKRKATIQYPGSTSQVAVSMGSVQPRDVGQVVRIDGLLGDRFVADVMGPTYIDSPIIQTPTINGAVGGSHGLALASYVDSGDASTLASAKGYVDAHPIVKGVVLGNSVDFNTLTTNGFYTQGTNAAAATGTNYPRPLAGVLEVKSNAEGTGIFVYQKYTIYGGYNPEAYVRTLYNGTWSAWSLNGPPGTLVRVGTNLRTTNSTNATVEYNICTFTLPNPVNGDVYRVRGSSNILPDTAGMYTALKIKHGANASVGGTQVGLNYVDHRAAGRIVSCVVDAEFTYTGTTGAAGYNVVLVGGPGTGGSYATCSAAQPAYLYVDRVL